KQVITVDTTKGAQTKEKIICIAARLFLEKGYNATGINEILEKSRVPKGSFYFHFANKKELASLVAEYYSRRLESWFRQCADGKNWPDFIAALVRDMKSLAETGQHRGCPLGVLGVEIAFVEPEIAGQYARSMDLLMGIFGQVLVNSGFTPETAGHLARKAYFLLQGYLQYYRVTSQAQIFDDLQRDVTNMVKQ
ncbi:MAG TPA: TetR/AcrR family transcriptional regulator, partial [Bacillota bacterium]|nr:TetR/AcrR family transcriptional regulator [Bacillota bacterium]